MFRPGSKRFVNFLIYTPRITFCRDISCCIFQFRKLICVYTGNFNVSIISRTNNDISSPLCVMGNRHIRNVFVNTFFQCGCLFVNIFLFFLIIRNCLRKIFSAFSLIGFQFSSNGSIFSNAITTRIIIFKVVKHIQRFRHHIKIFFTLSKVRSRPDSTSGEFISIIRQ